MADFCRQDWGLSALSRSQRKSADSMLSGKIKYINKMQVYTAGFGTGDILAALHSASSSEFEGPCYPERSIRLKTSFN